MPKYPNVSLRQSKTVAKIILGIPKKTAFPPTGGGDF